MNRKITYDAYGNRIQKETSTEFITYHYSPYGILLSTPSISQPHFLSGNAQCQYKTESSLYYMHARYYDAHTGRFLTKDALPGSLRSPLSQNRYTYCQNDPITLIDPTGNSPENTGNPPRMSGPQSSQQVSIDTSNPCYLPDVGNGDSIPMIDISGNNDCCYIYYRDVTTGIIYRDVIIPGEGNTTSTIRVAVGKDTSSGRVRYSLQEIVEGLESQKEGDENSPRNQCIDGIIDAIKAISKSIVHDASGYSLVYSLAAAFAQSDAFQEQTTTYNGEKNEITCWDAFDRDYVGKDKYYQWMKHSIIGGFIASKMSTDRINIPGTAIAPTSAIGVSESDLNRMIGFSVSFMYDRSGYDMPLYSSNGTMDLVGVANLMKAMIREERRARGSIVPGEKSNLSNVNEYYWNDHAGEVENTVVPGNKRSKYFAEFDSGDGSLTYEAINNSQFLSVIAGVGVLFISADMVMNYERPVYEKYSVGFWLESARRYNGGGEGITNDTNLTRIKNYCSNFKYFDDRYSRYVDQYVDEFLPTLVVVIE